MNRTKNFPKTTRGILLSTFAGGLLTGCQKDDSSESAKAPQLPPWLEQLPYDRELSDIPGVSIVQVKPGRSGHSRSLDTAGWRTATAKNSLLSDAIWDWVDFHGMVFVDAELPEDRRYNIEIDAPEGKTNLELARTAFEKVFRLEFRETAEDHSVWLLKANGRPTGGLKPVDSTNTSWGTAQTPGGFGYDFRVGSMADLAGVLGKYLEGGIVFDETGLEGFYQFQLSMNHWDPETALPALKPLGLRARKVQRELPTLRIDFLDDQSREQEVTSEW